MPIRVLIVDDEPDIRTLIRMLIEAVGSDIVVCAEASDGTEAVAHAHRDDPDVIVMDERMPQMTGIQAAVKILEQRPSQQIMLCSAFLDRELRARAESVGIRACVAKGEIARIPGMIRSLAAGGGTNPGNSADPFAGGLTEQPA